MNFAYPWVLLAPLVLSAFFFLRRGKPQAVSFPSESLFEQLKPSMRQFLRLPILGTLLVVGIVGMAVAAARPQSLQRYEGVAEARNIMLVVDVSRSMQARDFPTRTHYISRMEGVKQVVAEFVKERSNERLGLVVFGNKAYLQSPLTSDLGLVEKFVQSVEPGMAGDGTAIGDGLGLALQRLKELPSKTRAIVLMTDGANNAGAVNPIKAAKVAHDIGVKIHAIGIGTGKASIPAGGMFGFQQVEFDEETLKTVAQESGGVYFNARSVEGLKDVYAELEKLELSERDDPAREVATEEFLPYALIGFGSLLTAALLNATVFRRIPE